MKDGNWAYGFVLNHAGAGVGTIYYAAEYFENKGIVNPANTKPYTEEEINSIKNGTHANIEIPENAFIGMSVLSSDKVYWYDEENSKVILASAAPLILDAKTGEMKTMEGKTAAKAM